jgi:hypothetical protein
MKEPSVSEVRAMAADALAAFKQIFASLSPAQMIDTDAPFTMMKCFHDRDKPTAGNTLTYSVAGIVDR